MDYKEYEYICFHTYFGVMDGRDKLWFAFNPKDECQRKFVEKYKDALPQEFEETMRPFREKQKILRVRRLEAFKKHKPSDFARINIEQKLKYLDAITETPLSEKERTEYLCEYNENLRACLFSMQPSKKFLLEEQRNLNHFMNALIGCGLDKNIKETGNRNFEQRKQDMQEFVNIFCKVYEISEPDLIFEESPMHGQSTFVLASIGESDCYLKSIVKINENLLKSDEPDSLYNYCVLFHELTHTRQSYWQFSGDKKYAMFSKVCANLENLTYNQDLNYEIYRLLPKESHSFYMQRKFGEQCNERIFGDNAKQIDLNAATARTLWYDYQAR